MMKKFLTRFMGVSHGHSVITRSEAEQLQYDHQWQDPDLPRKQYAIVKNQLAEIATSQHFPGHMQALIDQMKIIDEPKSTVLEIGCSSGYNSEVMKLAGIDISYTGCDYSQPFIHLAKELYPGLPFDVCEATTLPYADGQFHTAISGCCILHILDYPKAIQETARVAQRYVIMSRTPVIHLQPTTYTKKIGYGIPMVEIFFNENELYHIFRNAGLRIVDVITFTDGPHLRGIPETTFVKTYLCEKV